MTVQVRTNGTSRFDFISFILYKIQKGSGHACPRLRVHWQWSRIVPGIKWSKRFVLPANWTNLSSFPNLRIPGANVRTVPIKCLPKEKSCKQNYLWFVDWETISTKNSLNMYVRFSQAWPKEEGCSKSTCDHRDLWDNFTARSERHVADHWWRSRGNAQDACAAAVSAGLPSRHHMLITQAKQIAGHRPQLQRRVSYRGAMRSWSQCFMPRAHFPCHYEAGYRCFPAENKGSGNEKANQDPQITSRAWDENQDPRIKSSTRGETRHTRSSDS